MTPGLLISAILLLLAAAGSVSFRRPIYCAFSLAASFPFLALLYLGMDAQFIGFSQILVYLGAVTILILFTVLLTRNDEIEVSPGRDAPGNFIAVFISVITFVMMAVIVWLTPQGAQEPVENLDSGIRKLGELLFSEYIVPIETIALLLTAALIGAVLIAMRESGDKEQS